MAIRLGADHIINVDKEDVVAKVREYTNGELCDIAFDCSGNPEALEQSTEFVKKGATIVTPGLYGEGRKPLSILTRLFSVNCILRERIPIIWALLKKPSISSTVKSTRWRIW